MSYYNITDIIDETVRNIMQHPTAYIISQNLHNCLDQERQARQQFYEQITENKKMELWIESFLLRSLCCLLLCSKELLQRLHDRAYGISARLCDSFVPGDSTSTPARRSTRPTSHRTGSRRYPVSRFAVAARP